MLRRILLSIAVLIVCSAPAPQPTAVRTFNVVARRFTFTITPSPFVVNAGDTVTLNISAADVEHGFFLQNYVDSLNIRPNSPRTVTFTANTAGTFVFFCTQSSCGTGHGLMVGNFIVNAAPLPPTISSFRPASGSTSGGTVVLIEGANFQNGATVKFGDVAAVSTLVNSATSISATAPAHDVGSVSITVTNSDGQSAVSSASYVYELPGPAITSITPATGPTSGGTPFTITGSTFNAGATVSIGGLPASAVQVVDATTINATTPTGPFDVAGSAQRDVTVTNPDGRSATRTGGFTWTVPAPSIASFSPSTVPPGGGTVAITGAGFTRALPVTVTVGGVAARDVQVVDAVTLTAVVPARAEGAAEVVVQVGSASARSSALAYQTPGKHRRAVRR